jgi:hypothetical protein
MNDLIKVSELVLLQERNLARIEWKKRILYGR